MCLAVTHIDGLVVARSGFNHSVNYRSCVVHGMARPVTDEAEFDRALQRITEHLLPDRYAEIRPVTAQERKATGVLALEIEAITVKVRSGPPMDEPEDHPLDLWSGILPISPSFGRGVPDGHTAATKPEPASLSSRYRSRRCDWTDRPPAGGRDRQSRKDRNDGQHRHDAPRSEGPAGPGLSRLH